MIGYREVQANAMGPRLATSPITEWELGGCTIDWTSVAAVSGSDVTLPGGVIIKVGQKYLAPGQVMCEITAAGATLGQYGPYDPAATGTGRETLRNGYCGLIDTVIIQAGLNGELLGDTDHCGLITGGPINRGLLRATTGTHTLAAGPTEAELLAAMPRLVLDRT